MPYKHLMDFALWALIAVAAFAVLNLGWFRLYLRACPRDTSVVPCNVFPIDSYRRRRHLPASLAR